MKNEKNFNIKIETPTLARRAIVVEDSEFKLQLQSSVNKLKSIISKHTKSKSTK